MNTNPTNAARILLVGDPLSETNDIERRLLGLGHAVDKVPPGPASIDLAGSLRPDLVLIDTRLHRALDSITIACAIRQRYHLPVVFLSSSADEKLLCAKVAKPFTYVLEPFEIRELSTNIEIALYKNKAELEIRRLNQLYSTLSQVNQAVACIHSREELFTKVCQIAVECSHFKVARIDWLDAALNVLIPLAEEGDEFELVTKEIVSHCGLDVVQSSQPRVVNDLSTIPLTAECRRIVERLGLRAYSSYPIRLQNRVCGVLTVATIETGSFDVSEGNLLEQISLSISVALEKLEAEHARQDADNALKEGGQHLKTILQSAMDGFYLVDTHGRLLQVNKAYCAMSCYTREELLKMSLADLEDAENEGVIAEHIKQIMDHGRDRFESRHRRKDGRMLYIESSVTFQDSNGGRFFCFLRDITERKAAEVALQTSEQHFRALFENMLEGFAYCQMLFDSENNAVDFVYLKVNSAFETFTGLTNVIGKKVTEVLPGIREIHPEYFEIYGRVVSTGQPARFETELETSGVWISIAVYRPQSGHFVTIFDNVTDRKRAEQELRKNEDLLTQAVGVAALGIFERDHRFEALRCSPGLRKIFGWRADEKVTIADLMERVLPEDRELLATGIRHSLATTGEGLSRTEYRIVRPDGIRWVGAQVQSFFEGEGGLRHPVRTVGAVQDITASKQIQLELSESRHQLRTAMEAAKLGFWTHNLVTGEIFRDERTQAIFGNSAGKTITFEQLLSFVVPEDRDRFERIVTRMNQKEDTDLNLEYRINLPDGSIRWIEGRVGIIRDESGKSIRTVGTVMDITEQKRAEHEMRTLEQQFRQAQKMEAVGRLAGGVAHDFNNLLMVIQSYTQMLQDSLPANDRLRKNTEQVLKATDRAASLTKQLLAFSRKQVLSPIVLDLNALVSEAADMLKRLLGEDVELRVSPTEELWAVKADPDQMVQVLMNLGVNARDAMPTGGTLTIATSNITMDEHLTEKYPFVPLGDYVLLSVADTGAGISKNVQDQIFEPFFTTKKLGKGTGLGLSTVFGIVKQSEGYVLVESEPGEGACFAICLPRMKDAVAALPLPRVEQAQRGTETLLVVEDEEALRESICDFLRSLGYTLLAAESGQQALSIASQHQGVIEILITDVVLPRMGGRELSQTLESQRTDLKTIYMSGYIDDAVLRYGVREEGVAFLQKPFALAALARKVRDMLRSTETM